MSHAREFIDCTRDIMNQYKLYDWSCGLNDRLTKVVGRCCFGPKLLEFSTPYVELNTVEAMTDVIKHEVAHALAGPLANHGAFWREVARAIGATPRACVIPGSLIKPQGNWIFKCDCTTHSFFRKPRYMRRRCRLCGGRGEVQHKYSSLTTHVEAFD